MDEHSKSRQFASDLAAGVGVGAAVGWALATLLPVPMVVALCAAGIAFLRVFCSLRRQHAGPRFALAPFQLAGLEFEADGLDSDGGLLELGEIAASIASETAPEQVREALPTVKQLQASIRRRIGADDFGTGDDCPQDTEHAAPADAAAELRSALRNLRRAIG
jgi:hypothetical protein